MSLNERTSNPQHHHHHHQRESGERSRDARPSLMAKGSDFLTDRRVSRAEMQRRHTWLQRTRLSVATARDRCRITHEVRFPETANGLYCARFAPGGDVFVSTFGTGGIQIRNGQTGDVRATLRSGTETGFPMMCCRFNPIRSNIFYASGACGNIFLCNTSTNEFSRFIEGRQKSVPQIKMHLLEDVLCSGKK